MSSYYDLAYEEVRAQIEQYSPTVLPVLEKLRQARDAKIAYYAGFVLVSIEAQKNAGYYKYKALDTMSRNDLQDFTFFDAIQGDETAIALFDELLRAYVAEQIKN